MSKIIENEDLRTAIEMLGGQTAVSKRLEIPYRTVQNWYTGTRNPPPYVARMIIEIAITEDEAENITFDLERELEALARTESGENQNEVLKSQNEVLKKQNEVLQKQFEAAMELTEMRRKEIESLESAIQQLEEQIVYLKKEGKNTH